MTQDPSLPRLVYIGDVPVAATMSGSILLWRLLEDYPADSLLVLETRASDAPKRLPNVRYERIFPVLMRLTRTRFARLIAPAVILGARARARTLEARVRGFAPDAVLTVTHGISWLTAAAVAKRLGVPLVVINHDWWVETLQVPGFLANWIQRQFGRVYREAKARLCVSAQMAQHYAERYGAAGSVLLPGRARNAGDSSRAPAQPVERPFTLVYAGGIFHDCASVLATVARALAAMGGRLVIFSDLSPEAAAAQGLAASNIVLGGFVEPRNLTAALCEHGDALLVTREPGMGLNAIISFPSKLADYTTTGLPIVVYAPLDSAAAEWSRQHGAALVVGIGDLEGLREAFARLAGSTELRRELGCAALESGSATFAHEVVTRQFFSVLAGALA